MFCSWQKERDWSVLQWLVPYAEANIQIICLLPVFKFWALPNCKVLLATPLFRRDRHSSACFIWLNFTLDATPDAIPKGFVSPSWTKLWSHSKPFSSCFYLNIVPFRPPILVALNALSALFCGCLSSLLSTLKEMLGRSNRPISKAGTIWWFLGGLHVYVFNLPCNHSVGP